MSFLSSLRDACDQTDISMEWQTTRAEDVTVDEALALLRKSQSFAEARYAQGILLSTLEAGKHIASNGQLTDTFGIAVKLLKDSRSAWEATLARKVLLAELNRSLPSEDADEHVDDKRLNRVKVLVVEDDSNYRSLLSRTIRRRGASVSEAGSLKEARLIIRSDRPDVIVGDIHLPDDSGFKLVQLGSKGKATIPVVGISGEPQDAEKLKHSGFRLFFEKEPGVQDKIAEGIFQLPEIQPRLLIQVRQVARKSDRDLGSTD